ncbi:Aste57867_18067 [Aphanomyces stellatus]|uniref:Aste57867_18067 protein n=1 Tax=Aphanomyces stellatus TaxID=120398 RepID=A0A485LA05_9STRA|nr:hypothetical protein As57867_018005 [Aphanomyces stellatus]VFT94806.1 Aste57867_18067 [Aphanomyces stellatus]
MSSGYEWASSTEAFLAATSGRRGISHISAFPNQPPTCAPVQPMTFDMDVYVAHDMEIVVSKRKMHEDAIRAAGFKRQRLQW